MTKQYPEYDVPKRSIKDRIVSQRWSALVIEGLLVLVAVVVTIGFLSPAAPVKDNRDSIIAELEATIAAQEAAIAEATVPTGVLSVSTIKTLAWDNLSNEEYRSAVAMYTILIGEGEADANTYAARGYALSRLEEHALAVQDYTTALELNPDMLSVYNNRCWAYSEIGEFDRALNDCNHLMSEAPSADYPYLNRGIVYEHMGNMDAANAATGSPKAPLRRGRRTQTPWRAGGSRKRPNRPSVL
jgi:tetratricopeptide (TPR) repeat protein